MLLTLLAVALPTAALANSINFSNPDPGQFFTGAFVGGTISRTTNGGLGVNGASFMVAVRGSMDIIRLTGATLVGTGCNGSAGASGTCAFTGGSIQVQNAAGTVTLFTDSLTNGAITTGADGATITATLLPSAGVGPAGGFVTFKVAFTPTSGTTLTGGTARVNIVPEPGTLGLLGSGAISLAGLVRRKLKLTV